ncbi:hypothetical protein RI129_002677 [Pyrocoelia pectoralis]|uniref:von Hippel-Lindau disease tumour suppressor beta domain-containing protein n=1 Tax=Pyrocoelia pectoralis TaxID=417401 RepID=A0AAN7VFQ9_9COLE
MNLTTKINVLCPFLQFPLDRALVRSVHSRQPSFIRVINLCPGDVDLIWIDFEGRYVKYAKLQEKAFVDVNTFETHPWIAVCSERKDKLLLNNKFIYKPNYWRFLTPYFQYEATILMQLMRCRIPVNITLPVYSLRYRALLEVRSYLKTVDDVDNLELPANLADALRHLMSERTCLIENNL